MIYRRQVGHRNTFAGTGVSRPINPLQDGEGGADGGGRVGIYMKVSESHISREEWAIQPVSHKLYSTNSLAVDYLSQGHSIVSFHFSLDGEDGDDGGGRAKTYLIFVIFFTRTKFLENKIYTEKRHFFA